MTEKTLRVLIADDIASNRTIVAAFLAELDCTPLFASDGLEAVDVFRREMPDVVLMDFWKKILTMNWRKSTFREDLAGYFRLN